MKKPLKNKTSAWSSASRSRHFGVRQAMLVGCLGLISPSILTASSSYTAATGSWNWSDTTKWTLSSGAGNTPAYPNAIGDTALRPTGTGAITQDIVGGVTVGTLGIAGGVANSINPTQGITLNQDGVGAGFATISNSSTSNLNNLTINLGVLTLADDLFVISSSTTSNTTTGAINLKNSFTGTGNMTFSNVDNNFAGSRIIVSGTNSDFTGKVNIAKGIVTFTTLVAFGGKAGNTITLGAVGQGDATLVNTAAFGSAPGLLNNIVVAAESGGSLILGSTSTATSYYGGTLTLNGNVSLTSASTAANALIFTNTVSGTGSIRFIGGGHHRLSGVNTFTGETSIATGDLQLGAASGATSLALQDSTVNLAAGDTGLVLFGTNASTTVVNATFGGLKGSRTLSLVNMNTTPAAVKLTLGNNNQDAVYSGALTGGGSIVKTGTGTQTFSGNSTYTGATTVDGGRLIIDGSITSAVTVNNGGTLGGHGTTGALTVASGGTIAPGNSPGILSVASATFANGSTFALDLKNDTEVAGTGWDQLAVTGQLNLSGVVTGGITLSLQSFEDYATTLWNGNVSHTWDSFITAGSIDGFVADGSQFLIDSSAFSGGGTWSVVQDGNALDLYYAVPEPATWAMMVGGFGMLIAAQRVRRRS